MEKERDGEAELQGLAVAEGLQRRCWGTPVSIVGILGCSKAEATAGLSQGLLPCGIAVSHHDKAPSSHAARGRGL